MIGIAISVVITCIANTVSNILGGGVVPPPPPDGGDRYLDGGNAFTEAFSKTVDGGDAFTTSFVIEYNGSSA